MRAVTNFVNDVTLLFFSTNNYSYKSSGVAMWWNVADTTFARVCYQICRPFVFILHVYVWKLENLFKGMQA